MYTRTQLQEAYKSLEDLIKKRQAFEASHAVPPYSTHPTNSNFLDINGHSLLFYAICLGDKEKVEKWLPQVDSFPDIKTIEVAMAIALRFGQLDVAKYIFKQDPMCSSISLSDVTEINCHAWYKQLIQSALANRKKAIINRKEEVFSYDFHLVSYPENRAAEVGDLKIIEEIVGPELKKTGFFAKSDLEIFLNKIFLTAAENGQLEVMKYCLKHGATINAKKKYCESSIIAVVMHKQYAALDYLIDNGVDVDYQGRLKKTPLIIAVENNDHAAVEKLLAAKADLSLADVYGNTALHYAFVNGDDKIKALLSSYAGYSSLIKHENIYGMTAEFVGKRREDFKKKVNSEHKNEEAFVVGGEDQINASQGSAMKKMLYFLKIQYRDINFFSLGGLCNGFTFLYHYYSAKGMENYFFDTLRLMASWDGSEESLAKSFKDVAQAKYYKNLGELFEQWIHDPIWFQHSNVAFAHRAVEAVPSWIFNFTGMQAGTSGAHQDNREYQYSVVGDEGKLEPIRVSRLSYSSMTIEQFLENIRIFAERMPSGMRLEFGGSSHATGVYINSNGGFNYYDPNFKNKAREFKTSDDFCDVLIDTKIIALEQLDYNGEFGCDFRFFYFKDPEMKKTLDSYESIKSGEFPESKEDVLKFQKKSPCNYSQLHIAVITGSIKSVEKLLKTGYFDLNAKDKSGRTALDLAILSLNPEMMTCLIQAYSPQIAYSSTVADIYDKEIQSVVDFLFKYADKIDLSPVLERAIKLKDLPTVKCMVSNHLCKIDERCHKSLLELMPDIVIDEKDRKSGDSEAKGVQARFFSSGSSKGADPLSAVPPTKNSRR